VGEAGSELASFEAAGRDLLERMVEYLTTVEDRPVSTPRSPSELAERWAVPLPRSGQPAAEVWDEVWDGVVGDAIHLAHPMYMGHQVAPPLPHAVLADTLASLLNQSVAVWEMSPTGTPVEVQVVAWMRELLGYPESADGTLVSGGSAANLTGLLAAREAVFPGAWRDGVAGRHGLDRAAVFVAAHAHYSMERSLGIMGLGGGAWVAVGERDHRLDPDALDRAIDDAVADGRVPLAIVATAGSTATGLFDDLPAIADIARDRGIWLHVDGAHGASFLASDRLRPAGRDRAGRLGGVGPPQDDVHAHLGGGRAGPGPAASGRGVPAERALPVPPPSGRGPVPRHRASHAPVLEALRRAEGLGLSTTLRARPHGPPTGTDRGQRHRAPPPARRRRRLRAHPRA
jgi:L-2,4-diaminobutyrate decarboxylase